MLNEKKIEEIRAKIQTSALLTDHEKSDWLNLLELMNDKQLGELEEILGAESAVASAETPAAQAEKLGGLAAKTMPVYNKPPTTPQATPATPPPAKQPTTPPGMPPLSHIANIPTDIAMGHNAVQSQAAAQTPAKVQTTKPAAPTTPTSTSTLPAHSGVTQPRLKLESLEEVQGLSLDTLRSYDLQSVVDALREQIVSHGYFTVLQLLEHSPLYDSYINSGKERLKESKNTISDSSLLTQEELEFMTDLLMHMRFNRW